jgi:hypothetical protein
MEAAHSAKHLYVSVKPQDITSQNVYSKFISKHTWKGIHAKKVTQFFLLIP